MYDAHLSRYSVILLDEAHERTLASDVLLGLLKPCLKRRPELRLVIMSATLSVDKFRNMFECECECLQVMPLGGAAWGCGHVRNRLGAGLGGRSCRGVGAVQTLGLFGAPPGESCSHREASGTEQTRPRSVGGLLATEKPRKTGGVLAMEVFWGCMGCLGGYILGLCTGV